jgi:enoyl-CoA hydratase/carnithine racemase
VAYKYLLTTREDSIAVVTLNRPDRRNALSRELLTELKSELAEIDDDHAVKVVILAGAGPVFCSGHDLGEMVGRREEDYEDLFAQCSDMMLSIQSMPQPVIAQVQGMATAAGCQLVAACDLAVAADTAQFATPGVRIGLFCTTPAVPIVRAVGRKRAMEMLLTAESISASTAMSWGMVNRVVPADRLESEPRELARHICQFSGYTIAAGKRAFYDQVGHADSEAYGRAQRAMVANALAPDAQEGISRFIQRKR